MTGKSLQFKFIHELPGGAKVAFLTDGLIVLTPHEAPYFVGLDGKEVPIETRVPSDDAK